MIAEKLQDVEKNIEAAKARRRADLTDDVTLIAVTKNHDVAAMREAIDAGATQVGENRVQEAQGKYETLDRKVTWHLIGHLQTNKAKHAVKMFDLIHSVDSEHLARAIDKEAAKLGKVQDILVQVNLAHEEQKSGVEEAALRPLLDICDALPNVRVLGLMFIAPDYEDREQCRPLFRRMHEIFLAAKDIPWKTSNIKYLSMGMSHDYEIAIEEGANIVRVGTAIFGPRQY
ncbi:YggS family pyridoxal phosphate-dependent enzyme [uncultured Selenomonas sp.]|uniref:YggS family pyridoxal phosphate-dependent enzyme n=1 Tax=uncultured Selenomonas sp. TaxID=159275 RepID=UPI0025E05336|nr:YggS family pyridoxal phosphate-dependent enzyme [uncultured Selenomonas sp.]